MGGCKVFVRVGGVEWCGGVEMKMKLPRFNTVTFGKHSLRHGTQNMGHCTERY